MDLTPSQKREATMIKRYGENWREIHGNKIKNTRIANIGSKEKYLESMRENGAKGGRAVDPKKRTFYVDRKSAGRAGRIARAKNGK